MRKVNDDAISYARYRDPKARRGYMKLYMQQYRKRRMAKPEPKLAQETLDEMRRLQKWLAYPEGDE